MRSALAASLLAFAAGCPPMDEPVDVDGTYSVGQPYDVEEPLAFTDVPYDFPADAADGIGTLASRVFPVARGAIAFGADDQFPDGDCNSTVDADLPAEIEGIVTVEPRFYYKTVGCDGDEKYYGSFFVQDRTGGVFVLGDSRVAHFAAGDRVRLRVRGVLTSFDLNLVYSHDVVSVDRIGGPVYYQDAAGPFTLADIGLVRRVTGTVVSDTDTFGEFTVEADDGARYAVSLDAELNRRGVRYPPGTRLVATGPVLYSYSVFSIVILQKGQIEVLQAP